MYKNSLPLSLLILASVITSSINAMDKDELLLEGRFDLPEEKSVDWFKTEAEEIALFLRKVDKTTGIHLVKNNPDERALNVDVESKIDDSERLLNILQYYYNNKYPYAVQNKNINDKTLSVVYTPRGYNSRSTEVKLTYSIIKRARL